MSGGPDATYADFVVGYGNPPQVGRNGAGLEPYDQLINGTPDGTMAIYVGSLAGVYDYRGTKFNNAVTGFRLERVRVAQGEHVYDFGKADMIPSKLRLGDFLILPPNSGFDPMLPWHASLYASALKPDGTLQPFTLAELDYTIPAHYILLPEPEGPPAWAEPWIQGWPEIAILCAALTVLTLILAFQATISRYRRLHRYLRDGFLVFTLVWIGWTASAQLSIVHIINYVKAPFENLDWHSISPSR